jgi:hypothetical protein
LHISTLKLVGLVTGLSVAVWLAATNPTMDAYLRFVETRLSAEIDKMDQSTPRQERDLIKGIFRSQGSKLIESVVRPNTRRNNWGLVSLFETNVLDQPVLVLGMAGQFIPLRGVEEATVKVGRLAF